MWFAPRRRFAVQGSARGGWGEEMGDMGKNLLESATLHELGWGANAPTDHPLRCPPPRRRPRPRSPSTSSRRFSSSFPLARLGFYLCPMESVLARGRNNGKKAHNTSTQKKPTTKRTGREKTKKSSTKQRLATRKKKTNANLNTNRSTVIDVTEI